MARRAPQGGQGFGDDDDDDEDSVTMTRCCGWRCSGPASRRLLPAISLYIFPQVGMCRPWEVVPLGALGNQKGALQPGALCLHASQARPEVAEFPAAELCPPLCPLGLIYGGTEQVFINVIKSETLMAIQMEKGTPPEGQVVTVTKQSPPPYQPASSVPPTPSGSCSAFSLVPTVLPWESLGWPCCQSPLPSPGF